MAAIAIPTSASDTAVRFSICNPGAFVAQIMQKKPYPSTNAEDVVRRLQSLVQTERRARLLALLPLVDSLHRQGVGFGAMAEQLKASELDLSEAALRMALYRWRKKNRTAPDPSRTGARPQATQASAAVISDPTSVTEAPASTTSEVTSKADLVRLRQSNQHIDLTQLANYGRKR
ncbi:hypothetical protein [Achromobacter xylosoxidans]|uniref:hypothetical protein n=1 Tax=Alcaligenes xylosoxydans xylosoxydans TaxID=85698 RepID=UPI00292F7030|nr:hypothetical protein [Achromobacter xylosoxidans]WOB74360.1 hypothetical protein PZA07_02435 [Achromobacter xylosoxidans]